MVKMNPNTPLGRVKLCCYVSPDPSEKEIDFLAVLGIEYAYTWMKHMASDVDVLERLIERLAKRGIKLNNCSDELLAKDADLILGTERRDDVIEAFARTMEISGKFGLKAATFTWEAVEMQSSGNAIVRGGAGSRMCDQHIMEKYPLSHGRVYEKNELWENFAYFMKHIIPVAESTGVRLALHPNDPPMPKIRGIASLITSYMDYKKAFEIANSKMLGMEFCCGCWLEGGETFGNIYDAFREFAQDGRVIITHLRNISSLLPRFEECFIDEGYGDIYKLIQTFYMADYDGTVILDHSPMRIPRCETRDTHSRTMVTHPTPNNTDLPPYREATAYALGYIKALMNAASHSVYADKMMRSEK